MQYSIERTKCNKIWTLTDKHYAKTCDTAMHVHLDQLTFVQNENKRLRTKSTKLKQDTN